MEEPWLFIVWRRTVLLYNGFSGKLYSIWVDRSRDHDGGVDECEVVRLPSVRVEDSLASGSPGGWPRPVESAESIELGLPVRVRRQGADGSWRFVGFDVRYFHVDLRVPSSVRAAGAAPIPIQTTLKGMCHPFSPGGDPQVEPILVYWQDRRPPIALKLTSNNGSDEIQQTRLRITWEWRDVNLEYRTLLEYEEVWWRDCCFFLAQSERGYYVFKLIATQSEIILSRLEPPLDSLPAAAFGAPLSSQDVVLEPEALAILRGFGPGDHDISLHFEGWRSVRARFKASDLGLASWRDRLWTIDGGAHGICEYRLVEAMNSSGQLERNLGHAMYERPHTLSEEEDMCISPPVAGPGYIVVARSCGEIGDSRTYLTIVS